MILLKDIQGNKKVLAMKCIQGLFIICILAFTVSCDNKIKEVRTGFWDLGITCIENHVYYRYSHSIAIKLDDDGKPIKCEIQK
jgi:TRAP-type uncharacterized transport system substrate-binding protein